MAQELEQMLLKSYRIIAVNLHNLPMATVIAIPPTQVSKPRSHTAGLNLREDGTITWH
jgi:hypothetical protein